MYNICKSDSLSPVTTLNNNNIYSKTQKHIVFKKARRAREKENRNKVELKRLFSAV